MATCRESPKTTLILPPDAEYCAIGAVGPGLGHGQRCITCNGLTGAFVVKSSSCLRGSDGGNN